MGGIEKKRRIVVSKSLQDKTTRNTRANMSIILKCTIEKMLVWTVLNSLSMGFNDGHFLKFFFPLSDTITTVTVFIF